jgi:hypothetical protein
MGCGSDSDICQIVDLTDPHSIYVDAQGGDDGNPGTEAEPLKTISHALSVAEPGDIVKVAPGLYDAALGEVFPITMPDSVTLIGDVDSMGVSSTPTIIKGVGAIDKGDFATLIAGHASAISGFNIVEPDTEQTHYCILSRDADITAAHNALESGYGCIRLYGEGDPVIEYNSLTSVYYGVYTSCTGTALIRDNDFFDGSYISNVVGSPIIKDNNFTGEHFTAICIQHGTPLIEGNSLTARYLMGAVTTQFDSTPILRGNTFAVSDGPCMAIQANSDPDLGTDSDPGNNTFTGTSGIAISQESPAIVDAIGNTWYSWPPACGSEIMITGTGAVVFGTGVSDTCFASGK